MSTAIRTAAIPASTVSPSYSTVSSITADDQSSRNSTFKSCAPDCHARTAAPTVSGVTCPRAAAGSSTGFNSGSENAPDSTCPDTNSPNISAIRASGSDTHAAPPSTMYDATALTDDPLGTTGTSGSADSDVELKSSTW
ncbi:hypothetical protein B0I28_108253 [Glycomyces artemisiae]|uniref:Uncharacterized protein n=1 Tax=Glycomyces artemisiae TaxID=1076443 RepID=A0A2T0UGA8_9ACTN|nr:hypothetical protein B0I28_108253 [Glycomyces artemisiae]